MNESRPKPISAVPADYVISKNDAGEVYAQSGRSGAVVACGKDASSVIQKAIDDLPTEGGKVYISAGCYWLNSTITIEDKHGVHLEGAARGIVFSQEGNSGTVLRSDRDIDLLQIFGNKLKVAGITISNLHLVGSGKGNGKAGILVRGDSDLLSLYNVGANHCGIGFHIQGGGGKLGYDVVDAPLIQFCDPQANGVGLKIERSHYLCVVGGHFSDCDDCGIMLSSPESGNTRCGAAKIIGVTAVRSGRAGILIGRNTEDITVTGGSDFGGMARGSGIVVSDEGTDERPQNIIISNIHSYNNRDAAILVESARHVIVQGCICSAHNHAYVDNPGQQHGIHIKAGSQNVIVLGNITYGNRKQAILDDMGKATIVNNQDG